MGMAISISPHFTRDAPPKAPSTLKGLGPQHVRMKCIGRGGRGSYAADGLISLRYHNVSDAVRRSQVGSSLPLGIADLSGNKNVVASI